MAFFLCLSHLREFKRVTPHIANSSILILKDLSKGKLCPQNTLLKGTQESFTEVMQVSSCIIFQLGIQKERDVLGGAS